MARLFKYILSAVILFGSVPVVQAMDMKMDNAEEVKKKTVQQIVQFVGILAGLQGLAGNYWMF